MSYSIDAVLWMIRIFFVYALAAVVMPYIFLRPAIRGKAVSLQLMVCTVLGNFYCISTVLLLGLLHVKGRAVYIMAALFPFVVKLTLERKRVKKSLILPAGRNLWRLLHHEISVRLCLRKAAGWGKRQAAKVFFPLGRAVRRNVPELLLYIVCMAVFIGFFAPNFYEHVGYKASDVVVHQQWINALDKGQLFYDGIYPMGMHAMIYYLHAVFGIHTYRLMQFFPFAAALFIFTMVLVVLKSLCRFRYIPYIGFFCLVGSDYIQRGMFSRYMSALPQEFGMMFYLPCLTAAVYFFREYRAEQEEREALEKEDRLYTRIGVKKKKGSVFWLWVLIISFSLTFTVHFYITILAGLLMVAVAAGYFREVFRPACFKKLLAAGLLSMAIALLPMVFAFVGGTPLQGSLYWATSVMGIDLKGAVTGESSFEETSGKASDKDNDTGTEEGEAAPESLADSLYSFYVEDYAIVKDAGIYRFLLVCFVILACQIPVMLLLGEREYGRIITVVLINHFLITFVGISGSLGLPALIDPMRMAGFQAYALPLCISLAMDSCLMLCSRFLKVGRAWQGVSLLMAAGLIAVCACQGSLRRADAAKSSIQTDGASLCLSSILKTYPEHKWTIVSCNEERNMMAGTGWHYEVIDFLSAMEPYRKECVMQIPTQYVFFYVEKESLNYALGEWDESVDPSVSSAWAAKALPEKSGLSQYQGTNRIILNSKMYYWAQEYMRRYPNEMKVFYEDDEFICYFIEQNEYYLHNFAVDYGYNEG